MTITATPKDPSANSYVDITYADSYFSTRYGANNWATFDTPTKEALLITATNTINLFSFGGYATTTNQSLKWPRTSVLNTEGRTVNPDVIPLNIKQATCELAVWLWSEEDRLLSDIELSQFTDFKVGPLTLKVNGSPIKVPPIVDTLLRNIGPGALLGTPSSRPQVSMCR
jgi:hypothetical protein